MISSLKNIPQFLTLGKFLCKTRAYFGNRIDDNALDDRMKKISKQGGVYVDEERIKAKMREIK